jgi:hypothetical protein
VRHEVFVSSPAEHVNIASSGQLAYEARDPVLEIARDNRDLLP